MSDIKKTKGLSVVDGKNNEKEPRVIVEVTLSNGEKKKYTGQWFGRSLEFEEYMVIGSDEKTEPVVLLKIEDISIVEIVEYEV